MVGSGKEVQSGQTIRRVALSRLRAQQLCSLADATSAQVPLHRQAGQQQRGLRLILW